VARGFGFIVPEDGGDDVYVHISVVRKSGFNGLVEGAKVAFDVSDNRGKRAAENLRPNPAPFPRYLEHGPVYQSHDNAATKCLSAPTTTPA
jgi:CspA family cold shock protein